MTINRVPTFAVASGDEGRSRSSLLAPRSSRPVPRSSLLAATPSRHDNPFATCWTRPGAIPYRFTEGQSAEQLVAKLAAQRWWGAILGTHGSGKSTLLETLKSVLRAQGVDIRAITLRDKQRRLPDDFWPLSQSPSLHPSTLIIIDGYEQLSWLERARLKRRCRRANCGLLVTTHAPTRIPLLIRLAPDEHLVQRLVADLSAQVSTHITTIDVAASHACHGSNVRETLFDLYDRHESLRRS